MNRSSLDLNLLVVLHTVLEEKTVRRAAERLHVTPPAVSNALARLRDVLGDALLVRRGRGLVPTPRALELAPRLAAALGEIERAIDDGNRFDPALTRRRFVLACSDSDQIWSIPRIVANFAREFPLAQLHVVSVDQLIASDGLATGVVDVAIAPAGVAAEGLHAEDLYADEAVLVLRDGHPLGKKQLSRAQFNALRQVDVWLALGRAGAGNRMAEAFFERHGLSRQVALIVPGFAAAAMVAAATDLAAAMPRRAAEKLAERLPLRVVRIPSPAMWMQLALIWHPRTHEDPGASHFRRLIIEALKEPPGDHLRRRARSRSRAGS
jgi:DNA-binding transcriptional LysR family regulator